MNRNQARALIAAELEEGNLFYTQSNLEKAIQDIYDEVVLLTFPLERSISYALQENVGYLNLKELIPDYFRTVAVFNEQTKRWLDPVTRDALDAIRLDWELMTGTPRWISIVSPERIVIAPRPAASVGTLTIFYNALAPTLSGNTSFELPLETQEVIQKGSLREMQEQAREFSKAQLKNQDYNTLIKETAIRVSRRASPHKVYKLCPSGQIRR